MSGDRSGAGRRLRQNKISLADLTGSADVIVKIGPDYRPTEVRLDGNTVSVKAGLPASVTKAMPFMRTITWLTGLGTPLPITAPDATDLLRSDEVPASA